MKHLGRSAAFLVVVRAAGIGLQAAVVVYLARVLPVGDMGVYATVYAFAALTRALGPLGTDQTLMRRIGERGMEQGAVVPRRVQELCNSALALVASVGTAAGFVAALVLGALRREFGLSLGEVLAIALVIPVNSLTGALVGQIRGFGYNVRAQLPEAIGFHLMFTALLFGFSLRGGVDRARAIYGMTTAAWSVLCMALVVRRKIGWAWTGTPNVASLWRTARESLPACWAMTHTVLAGRAPAFLTAWLLGSAATANLEIAMRFGIVATIVTSSVGVTFSPRFARLAHSGAHGELLYTLRSSSLLAGVPALAYWMVLAVAAPRLLAPMLPSDYAGAQLPMLVIAASACVNAVLGPASNLLFMAGHVAAVSAFSLARLLTVCVAAVILAGPIEAWPKSRLGSTVTASWSKPGTGRGGGCLVDAIRKVTCFGRTTCCGAT